MKWKTWMTFSWTTRTRSSQGEGSRPIVPWTMTLINTTHNLISALIREEWMLRRAWQSQKAAGNRLRSLLLSLSALWNRSVVLLRRQATTADNSDEEKQEKVDNIQQTLHNSSSSSQRQDTRGQGYKLRPPARAWPHLAPTRSVPLQKWSPEAIAYFINPKINEHCTSSYHI